MSMEAINPTIIIPGWFEDAKARMLKPAPVGKDAATEWPLTADNCIPAQDSTETPVEAFLRRGAAT